MVLGEDPGFCGQSWVRIRAQVGALGPRSGREVAKTQAGAGSDRVRDPKGSGSEPLEPRDGPDQREAQYHSVQEIFVSFSLSE